MSKHLSLFLCMLLSFLFLTKCNAQILVRTPRSGNEFGATEEANLGLVAGYTSSQQYNMLEIGVGYQPWDVDGFFVWYPYAGFLALYEINPNGKLYGTSLNAWYLSGPLSCGLNINRYSDYSNSTYGIKPMIGISSFRIGIMYGYNFFINSNSIENLQNESITIKYYLPIWKKK